MCPPPVGFSLRVDVLADDLAAIVDAKGHRRRGSRKIDAHDLTATKAIKNISARSRAVVHDRRVFAVSADDLAAVVDVQGRGS
jgi:hypothetical protein